MYQTRKHVDIPDLAFPTYESCEIHSMSMEFFAHPWMEFFFKEDEDKYLYTHIREAFTFLPYGCLVDHFQHEVYRHPEYSCEERKQLWRDLEKQYKEEETLEFLHLVQESELSFDDITELIRGNMLFGKDKAKEKKGDQNV